MEFNQIAQKIENDDDEVDIVLQYSKIINHLSVINENIGLAPTDDKLINKVNDAIITNIHRVLNAKIMYFKDIINFHLNRKKEVDNKLIVNDAPKTNKLKFNFTSVK